ncbi:GNAT family N-acetyltransferase [Plastorhodobacter daqingensis]|uniref:GNAT family N-acetyltransferase n=1 Tax=Plastorhodobacter daqingensis TaxID=1387281 RepID=A0ABW2UHH1_9RHOB
MSIALSNTPVLRTERLVLRAPGPQDWESCAAFMASDRARYVGGPLSRDKAWRSFGHLIGHWVLRGWGMFVFCDGARPLGMVGPWFPEGWPEREIGWSVWAPEAEGKGYAAEAARAARDHAFTTLEWNTAVSYIDPPNRRSVALAERLGARLDPQATPLPGGPCLVYRHTASGASA